jgi:hypothetical protein
MKTFLFIGSAEGPRPLLAVCAFDPNQPRDEDGKWTNTGVKSGPWEIKDGHIHHEGQKLDPATFTYSIKQTGPGSGEIEKKLIEGRFTKTRLYGKSSINPLEEQQKQAANVAAWQKIEKQRIPIMKDGKVVVPKEYADEIDQWLRSAGQNRMADFLKNGPRGE